MDMRAIFGLVFMLGLTLAGAAVYMAKSYIGQQADAVEFQTEVLRRTGGFVEVLVVTTQKKYGQTLSQNEVRPILWPKNAVPQGAFTDKAALFPQNTTAPRYITRDMEPFEPILAVKVTTPGKQAGLNGDIETGQRAFALQVAVSDYLQTGDHVDLYWTSRQGGSGESLTRLIETRLNVINVDRNPQNVISDGSITSRSVTVAVTPEQVGRLAQAQATGSLVVSLVGIDDETDTGNIKIDNRQLLGIAESIPTPIAETAPAPQVCTVRSRRGTEVVVIPIPCTE
jgi:pilus assembly protein CpaB